MTTAIRLLYVDDEPGLLDIGKLFLEKGGEFAVDTLTSAKKALEQLNIKRYDAIISDYKMPDMDGLEFLKQVRIFHGQIPFILFTGRGREEVVILALNNGADFYLQKGGEPKPQFAELSHKIRQAVNQKRSEEALRESELFLKETQQIARLGGWKANPHTDYLVWTDGIYDIIEAPRDFHPMLTEGMKYYAPEDIPVIREKVATCLATGEPFAVEAQIITETGKKLWTEVRGLAPVIEGARSYVVGTLQDITERKKAAEELQASYEQISAAEEELRGQFDMLFKSEKDLRESEARYRLISENTADVIWTLDCKTGMFSYVSPSVQKLRGYTPDEVMDQTMAEALTPDSLDAVNRLMQEGISKRKPGDTSRQTTTTLVDQQCKDGSVVSTEVVSTMVFDELGHPVEIIGISRDITERKRADEALKHQSATLSILNGIISTANKADNLPQLLSSILEESLHLLDFDAGGIYLVDCSTRTANVVHSKNLPDEFLAEIQPLPIDKKPYDTLFIKNEPIISENYVQIAPSRSKKYGFVSMASIPLLSKGVAIGALNLASKRRQVISEEEKQTLIAISQELGSTIERMAAEEDVKKAVKNLETLFNSIDEMVFVLDMQGQILVVNDTVQKRLLYTTEELSHTNVLLLHVPERRDEALHIVEGMIAGTIDSCPVPVIAKDGTRIEVETKVTRGWWNGKEVLIGVSRDVSERKQVESALRESEEKFRATLEQSMDGILITDGDFNIIEWNATQTAIYGYTREEMLGRPLWEFQFATLPEEKKSPVVFEDMKQRLLGMHTSSDIARMHSLHDFEVQCKDGQHKTVQISSFPIVFRNSMIFGSFSRDITSRKRAEEALQESEEKFRLIVENSHDIIYTLTAEGKFIFVSPVWTALLGHPVTEVTGHSFQQFVHPDDLPGCMVFLQSVITKGQRQKGVEYRVQHKDGTWYWHTSSAVPFKDESGTIAGFYGIARDITDRKRAEEALRGSEEKLSLFMRYCPNPVYIKDEDTRAVILSHHFEKMLGKPLSQLLGKTGEELWPPELAAEMRADDEKVMKEACIIEREENFEGRNFFSVKFPIPIPNRPTILGGYTIDITDSKRVEEALNKANRKLTLLSSITRHDINNQLMVLVGYLGLMEKKQTDASFNEYLLKASNAAQRISSMIQFTREYENIGINAPVWQDIWTLVDTTAKQAPLGHIIIKNDLFAGTEVFADPLIVKVFYNLMDNAVRYGKKITYIWFSVDERDGDQIIVCEDDGVGIPAEEKERIFTRGFGKNTGLGLALSREILDITGITLSETGEPGKGARFEMTVPKGMWRITGNDA